MQSLNKPEKLSVKQVKLIFSYFKAF